MRHCAVLAVASSAWLAACAGTPVSLDSRFSVNADGEEIVTRTAGCPFSLGALHDGRDSPDDLGALTNRKVQSEDPLIWLGNGLKTLPGFQEAPAALTVDAELLMAYTRGQVSSKVVNIVARLQYRKAGQPTVVRTYRGSTAGANWASSESEINGAFHEALDKLLQQATPDLQAACGARPSA